MPIKIEKKLKDGSTSVYWRVYYYDGNGRRHARQFSSQAEAKKFERDSAVIVAAARLREQGANPEGLLQATSAYGNITVDADFLAGVERAARHPKYGALETLLPKFLADRSSEGKNPVEPSTLRTYERRLLNAFEFLGGARDIGDVNGEDILVMVGAMRSSHRFSDDSIENTLTSLRVFFGWLIKEKILKGDNPADGIHALKKKDRVLIRPITEEMILSEGQMEAVKAKLEERVEVITSDTSPRYVRQAHLYRAFLLTAINTGMRNGEIRALEWRHIDFENKIILVRQNMDMETDEIGAPKTERSVREVPMVSTVERALRALAEITGSQPNDLIFTGPRIKTLLTYNTAEKMWKAAQRHAGISDKKNFHSIRHYFASYLFENGYDEVRVSEMLGHHSVDFTRKKYVHIINKQKRIERDVAALEKALVTDRQARINCAAVLTLKKSPVDAVIISDSQIAGM